MKMRRSILALVFLGCFSLASACRLQWTIRMSGFGISNYNVKKIRNTTEKQCMAACEAETDFECISIEFKRGAKYCFLQRHGRYDVEPGVFSRWPSFIYLERTQLCPDCHLFWTTNVANYGITHNNEKRINGVSEEECRRLCEVETDFLCYSIDYKFPGRRCYLASVRKADVPDQYEEWPKFSFSERNWVCSGCELKWTSRVPGYGINYHNAKKLLDISEDDCRSACEDEEDFRCVSFDWNRYRNYCYLAKVIQEDVPRQYNRWPSYIYNERTFVCPDCTWQWSWHFAEEAISVYNNRRLIPVTEEECMRACENEQEFICKSVDWQRNQNKCFVSAVKKHQVPNHWTSWPNYNFHQRRMECDCPLEWTATVRQYDFAHAQDKTVIVGNGIGQCKVMCENEVDFKCVAVTERDGTCYLFAARRVEFPSEYIVGVGVTYAERNAVCKGCQRQWIGEADNTGMRDHLDREFTNVGGLGLCKAACRFETDFPCKAVIYNAATDHCYLTCVVRADAPDYIEPMSGYTMYEKKLQC